MSTESQMLVAPCPACTTRIRFHDAPQQGDVLFCPECETRLEVIRRWPLKLDWASEEWLEEDDEWLDR